MIAVNCPFCNARNVIGTEALSQTFRCSCGANFFLEPGYDGYPDDNPGEPGGGTETIVPVIEGDGRTYNAIFY